MSSTEIRSDHTVAFQHNEKIFVIDAYNSIKTLREIRPSNHLVSQHNIRLIKEATIISDN